MGKRKLIISLVVALILVVGLTSSVAAQPPTEEEVRIAIENGVSWLADQQNGNGYWGNWEVEAVTALAIKKLEHHAVDTKWGYGLPSPFDPAYPYADNVAAGLNWLFDQGNTIPIVPQPAGDPDTDGDGLGVYFGPSWGHVTYTTASALMAICEAVEMDKIVESGPLAGWTYAEVAEDTMNYLAFAQNDAGNIRGGWGYTENMGWSDQSNSGYVALALGFYETEPPLGFGQIVPQFVKDELTLWIEYVQCDPGDPGYAATYDGGSGYSSPGDWVNILKTGNLLQQMAFVGWDDMHPRVQRALAYMCQHWYDADQDPGWKGLPGGVASYQATFTAMKGFTSLGIHELPCDPPIDWQADFETDLLEEQLADGSWPITLWDYGGNRIMSTIWALMTLQKVAPPGAIEVPVDIKPMSCPNPLNVKSQGVLPVAVLGTEDFDVMTIAPESVLLIGVAPLRCNYEDVATPFEPYVGKEGKDACTTEGPDGFMDLTLKFERQAIVAALGDVNDGDVIVLQLTGNLKEEFGGTSIVGEDVVWILKKGK
jgi:hypothetical protein